MTAPDPYGHTTLHGKPIDNATAVALRLAEVGLGRPFVVFQGIGGAAASAGTHAKGRVVDLSADHATEDVGYLKRHGFMVYHRRERAGVWPAHIHAALIFESYTNPKGIDPSALAQIQEYRAGGDGLVGDGRDPDPWRPDPIPVFSRDEYRDGWAKLTAPTKPVRTNVEKARYDLRQAIADLDRAVAHLDDVDPARVVAKNVLDDLRRERGDLRRHIAALPER